MEEKSVKEKRSVNKKYVSYSELDDCDEEGESKEDSPREPKRRSRRKSRRPSRGDLVDWVTSVEQDDTKKPLSINKDKRKRELYGQTWNYFVKNFEFSTPDIQDHAQDSEQYFSNIQILDTTEVQKLNKLYVDMCKTFVEYWSRTQGNTSQENPEPTDIQFDLTKDHWELFVGLQETDLNEIYGATTKPTLNFEEIHRVIDWFEGLDDARLATIKRYRHERRLSYLGEHDWRTLELDGATWLVHRHCDLPWFVPVKYHWHNPKAIRPEFATMSEMVQCGRLVGANERIYVRSDIYRKLIPLAIRVNKLLCPGAGGICLWDNWDQGENFFWARPCYELVIIPNSIIGYSMYLCFEKRDVDDNLSKTFVPDGAVIYNMAGEVRPVDKADNYAFDMFDTKEGGSAAPSNLVTTVYSGNPRRPGVGNAGYMANCACGAVDPEFKVNGKLYGKPMEFFTLYEARLGNKEKNCIDNADYIYKYVSIRALGDLKGHVIKAWHESKYTEAVTLRDKYLFPVEFVYYKKRDVPSGDPSLCHCATRCAALDHRNRSITHIFNDHPTEPVRHGDVRAYIESEFPKLSTQSKTTQANRYLAQYGLSRS